MFLLAAGTRSPLYRSCIAPLASGSIIDNDIDNAHSHDEPKHTMNLRPALHRTETPKLAGMRPREAVYATLKRRILLNDLEPGAALTELGLAQELMCSQGTVREALLRLQEDGLVLVPVELLVPDFLQAVK